MRDRAAGLPAADVFLQTDGVCFYFVSAYSPLYWESKRVLREAGLTDYSVSPRGIPRFVAVLRLAGLTVEVEESEWTEL